MKTKTVNECNKFDASNFMIDYNDLDQIVANKGPRKDRFIKQYEIVDEVAISVTNSYEMANVMDHLKSLNLDTTKVSFQLFPDIMSFQELKICLKLNQKFKTTALLLSYDETKLGDDYACQKHDIDKVRELINSISRNSNIKTDATIDIDYYLEQDDPYNGYFKKTFESIENQAHDEVQTLSIDNVNIFFKIIDDNIYLVDSNQLVPIKPGDYKNIRHMVIASLKDIEIEVSSLVYSAYYCERYSEIDYDDQGWFDLEELSKEELEDYDPFIVTQTLDALETCIVRDDKTVDIIDTESMERDLSLVISVEEFDEFIDSLKESYDKYGRVYHRIYISPENLETLSHNN